jgi:cysteine sulfinate desulfinase/cysteine desulfurase-like protein
MDHAATTYVKPEVVEEMLPFLLQKNSVIASSIYTIGENLRRP